MEWNIPSYSPATKTKNTDFQALIKKYTPCLSPNVALTELKITQCNPRFIPMVSVTPVHMFSILYSTASRFTSLTVCCRTMCSQCHSWLWKKTKHPKELCDWHFHVQVTKSSTASSNKHTSQRHFYQRCLCVWSTKWPVGCGSVSGWKARCNTDVFPTPWCDMGFFS